MTRILVSTLLKSLNQHTCIHMNTDHTIFFSDTCHHSYNYIHHNHIHQTCTLILPIISVFSHCIYLTRTCIFSLILVIFISRRTILLIILSLFSLSVIIHKPTFTHPSYSYSYSLSRHSHNLHHIRTFTLILVIFIGPTHLPQSILPKILSAASYHPKYFYPKKFAGMHFTRIKSLFGCVDLSEWAGTTSPSYLTEKVTIQSRSSE